jgi:hypothetical protein
MANFKEIDTSWLGIDTPDEQLFNPMDFIFKDNDQEKIIERLCVVMSNPDYFAFTCKYILNVEILPFQMVMLKELWEKKYPMIIASRGASKSFTMAIYCILRCLLMPKRKVIVVGAAFRQSKVIFEYMETIWRNAPILRDLCDNNSGPSRGVDSCVLRINEGTVTCLPLGNGEKIRGQRANDIIADEFASIPREIFENVVQGFASVASNPVEKVKMKARERLGKVDARLSLKDLAKDNQVVLAGTAYYDFNHFAEYWKKYRSWVYTRGDKKRLEEVLGGPVGKGFNWEDYTILRIPVDHLPEGLMDEGLIARAKATVHSGIYNMEYGAIFTTDSQGFFRRTLIESCVPKPEAPIKLPSGEVYFESRLFGDHNKKYIFGVDPASEVDHFSIVILEIHKDHRRTVYCWTTNRQQHKEKVRAQLVEEKDFYSYCARKIRDLMKLFPCQEIAMDAQGGGIAVMEALHDDDKIKEGEHPIWPVIDPDDPKDTDDLPGLHIVKLCQFSKADWVAEANHGMRKDMEDKVLLFPYFDPISLGMATEMDNIDNRLYDTLEDCVMDLEEMKNELSIIEITVTPNGRERWDTPEIKTSVGKKTRLRKDRYSALLMANMSARSFNYEPEYKTYDVVGGVAQRMTDSDDLMSRDLYSGPVWWVTSCQDFY